MKTFFQVFLAVFISLGIIFVSIFLILSAMTQTSVNVPDHALLYIDLSGDLMEYVAPDPIEEALGRTQLDMRKFRDDLEKAAVDDRIEAVVIRPDLLQVGFGKLEEMVAMIRKFRRSGKKIYAYLGADMSFTRDYYVASACDSVFMPAEANLFLTGVRSEVTFYKDFFNKVGVKAQFLHIGKYKNAPDSYTRDRMSPYQKEVLNAIVNQYYDDIVQTISKNRGLSPKQIDRFINQKTGFSGSEAKALGLIDGNLFYAQLKKKLAKKSHSLHPLSALDYAREPASALHIRNKRRIAVINCVGTIYGGSESENPMLGKMLGAKTIIANIQKAAKSRSVKAIILRIDSPGGASLPSAALWQAITEAKKKKPVIASVSDLGASGGYYMAMAADTIVATPNSLVGSIGIFAGKFVFNGTYDKLGMNVDAVQKGRHAGIFSVTKPWDKEEKKIIQNIIQEFYHEFVSKVARARHKTYEEVDQLAQGHVWTGLQAFHNGLVDTIGTFYTAINLAKRMAGIPQSESVRLVNYPRKKSFMNELLSGVGVVINHRRHQWVADALNQVKTILVQWQNKPLALLPFRLEFK
jgi:protease-4